MILGDTLRKNCGKRANRETMRLLCFAVTNFTVNKVPPSSGKQHRIKNKEKDLTQEEAGVKCQDEPVKTVQRRIYKSIVLTTAAALPFQLVKIKIQPEVRFANLNNDCEICLKHCDNTQFIVTSEYKNTLTYCYLFHEAIIY